MAHQGVMQSFPDRKTEILDLVEQGDTVCIRSRVTGTNQGGFPAAEHAGERQAVLDRVLEQVPPARTARSSSTRGSTTASA